MAEALRSLRVDAGLSTTQLARQLRWSQSKVSKTERGITLPPASDVEAWAACVLGRYCFNADERVHQHHGYSVIEDFDGLRAAATEGEPLRAFLRELIAELPET